MNSIFGEIIGGMIISFIKGVIKLSFMAGNWLFGLVGLIREKKDENIPFFLQTYITLVGGVIILGIPIYILSFLL